MYCLVCAKNNDTKLRFRPETVYCKYCGQSQCMCHIPALYPDEYGDENKQNWSQCSLKSRLSASGKCCKGDDVTQVKHLQHILF